MKYARSKDGTWFVYFETGDYIDPQAYESSENDPIAEREEDCINRIVWGKKIHLPPIILEGEFRAD